jgi:hypothetical protein
MHEVHQRPVDVVGVERTAHATLPPPGAEHEMLDDQLAAPIEEVGERLPARRAIEHIGLFDLDPGQFAALCAQLVAQPGELLFSRQMRLARGQPLVSHNDPMMHHPSIS